MKIKTNQEIKKGYLSNTLKAKDVIAFLSKIGFTTEKEVEKTALSELNYHGRKIEKVALDSGFINITFKK
jgi:hypothetical protein